MIVQEVPPGPDPFDGLIQPFIPTGIDSPMGSLVHLEHLLVNKQLLLTVNRGGGQHTGADLDVGPGPAETPRFSLCERRE